MAGGTLDWRTSNLAMLTWTFTRNLMKCIKVLLFYTRYDMAMAYGWSLICVDNVYRTGVNVSDLKIFNSTTQLGPSVHGIANVAWRDIDLNSITHLLPSKCCPSGDGTDFGRMDPCSNPANTFGREMEPNHPELDFDLIVNRVQRPKKQ